MTDWSYPDTDDQIDPHLAKFLYEQHCALLIVEDLPFDSEFGIDLSSFRTRENFKGVKMIPPGVHFVFASAVDKSTNQCGPRCGFYHNFTAKELLVKRWSTSDEDFDDSYEVSEEQRERYLADIRGLDKYLGSYRYSTYKTYLALTDKLTASLVQDLVPRNGRIRSVPYLVSQTVTHKQELDSDKLADKPKRRTLRSDDERTSKPIDEEDLLPDLKPAQETVIRFTKLATCGGLPRESSGQQQQPMTSQFITQYHLDSTLRLEQSYVGESGRDRLLGEFQFAFITLIIGHVYECFEHWRNILILVCSADAGLVKYPGFFVQFALILEHQLDQVSGDIFEDITQTDNLIRHYVDIFIQNVQQTPGIDRKLASNVTRLRGVLENKLGWIFELEPDDERPVIVEL